MNINYYFKPTDIAMEWGKGLTCVAAPSVPLVPVLRHCLYSLIRTYTSCHSRTSALNHYPN